MSISLLPKTLSALIISTSLAKQGPELEKRQSLSEDNCTYHYVVIVRGVSHLFPLLSCSCPSAMAASQSLLVKVGLCYIASLPLLILFSTLFIRSEMTERI